MVETSSTIPQNQELQTLLTTSLPLNLFTPPLLVVLVDVIVTRALSHADLGSELSSTTFIATRPFEAASSLGRH